LPQLLTAYRNRYASDVPLVGDGVPAWELAATNVTSLAFATAEVDAQTLRASTVACQDELGLMARQRFDQIKAYAAVCRSLQVCRREALGLPAPSNTCDKARLAEYDSLAFGDEEVADDEVASSEEAMADGLL
jgi:hypothetical protein